MILIKPIPQQRAAAAADALVMLLLILMMLIMMNFLYQHLDDLMTRIAQSTHIIMGRLGVRYR